eukprot:gene20937-27138_t
MSRPIEIYSTDILEGLVNYPIDNSIELLRERFPNFDDETLARFFIARNGNTDNVIKMLDEHAKWRANTLPIVKSNVLNEMMTGKIYTRGFDKAGHPIIIWNKVMPKDKSKITIIMNRVDFTQDNADIELCKKLISLFQANYPERLANTIVYPSGYVFYGLWTIVKFFLDPVTQKKVHPVLTLAGVQEFVDDKWIPKNMGGLDDYVFSITEEEEYNTTEDISAIHAKESVSNEVTSNLGEGI